MTSVPDHDPETAARSTLALLETRLRRLEFLLTGTTTVAGVPDNAINAKLTSENRKPTTVTEKLKALESSLDKLARIQGPAGSLVRDVEKLSRKYPEAFPSHSSDQSSDAATEVLSVQASAVLSHAALYPMTASRLSSLENLHIPTAEQSTLLVQNAPKIKVLHDHLQRQNEEIRQLRERSARCLEWWVKIGVVGMGDLWQDWESRMSQVELEATRAERHWKEHEGYV